MRLPPYPKYRPSGVEWLGEVPEHWDVKRGRFCMDVNPRSHRLRILRVEDEVSFVPMEAVGEYGGMNLEQTRAISDVGSGYTEFDDGDVVVAKITPCFENGKGALAAGLLNGAAFGTTELHVLRSASNLERRFLFYFTISRLFRSTGEGEMYGAGGQKRVPPEFCENVRVPLPLADEQRAIADFLDRETAEIDTLVAKKRTLIERLKEKRTALISRTVTRGLPPDAARAAGLDPHPKLKPSGIDWLGDVPEHWGVKSLKYALSGIVSGGTPEVANDAYWASADEAGHHWVAIADMTRNPKIRSSDRRITEAGRASKDLRVVPPGTLLYSMYASLGKVAVLEIPAAFNQAILALLPDINGLGQRYLRFWLNSMEVRLELFSSSNTQDNLNAAKVRDMPLFLPERAEQRAIADFLDRETAQLDVMVARVGTAIERLEEYRSALITAAVTGKIDVRGAVA